MSAGFVATLSDYYAASSANVHADVRRAAADRLPLSEWSESMRAGGAVATPKTTAMNWRSNVADTAHELRQAITAADNGGTAGNKKQIKRAARGLLRALGEEMAS